MKPVKCDPAYLQMARAALIEKLRHQAGAGALGFRRSTVRQRVQGPRVHHVRSAQAWTDSRTPNWSIRRWRC